MGKEISGGQPLMTLALMWACVEESNWCIQCNINWGLGFLIELQNSLSLSFTHILYFFYGLFGSGIRSGRIPASKLKLTRTLTALDLHWIVLTPYVTSVLFTSPQGCPEHLVLTKTVCYIIFFLKLLLL